MNECLPLFANKHLPTVSRVLPLVELGLHFVWAYRCQYSLLRWHVRIHDPNQLVPPTCPVRKPIVPIYRPNAMTFQTSCLQSLPCMRFEICGDFFRCNQIVYIMCGWCVPPGGIEISNCQWNADHMQIICRSLQIICLQYSDNIMWDVGNEIANKPTFDGLSFFLGGATSHSEHVLALI